MQLRPQVVQGRPALAVAWVRLLEPWRFAGRHCHAETVHDTCSRRGATWRSGDAADCKSAHPGSIPGVASQGARSWPQKCWPGLSQGSATLGWRALIPRRAWSGCPFCNRRATPTSCRGRRAHWTCGPGSERRPPHQIVKAKGVIRCPGAALRATVAVARRLDVKEFAQCADVDCSDAGRYCSPVLPSAVRRLALEVMGAVGAIAFTRCRSSFPVRCRPRLSTTRRIAVGTVGREAIAVRVIAAAGIGEPAVGAWLCRAGTPP